MASNLQDFDFENAVDYHYGQFPPVDIDYAKLVTQLGSGPIKSLAQSAFG